MKPLILWPIQFEGESFFTTNLKTPKRFDLIAYRAIIPDRGITTLVHRVCGVPGDVAEMKAGTLYVNGKDVDADLSLKQIYKVSTKYAGALEYKEAEAFIIPPYTDTVYIPLEDDKVKKDQLPCQRYVLPAGLRDDGIFRIYQKNWNRDNFGPLRVPSDKFFVLGDNRGHAMDSRYIGLIAQDKVMGTVLWK
ncbi:signal peptidase I [Puia dinghuensis]|uniref:signal peptidase I n=1 Tax=Puia dinghuensis TaxID=1792502 RepID=UPI001664A194|nr:signal peptidase I [Puia dinghuensis]